MQLFKMEDVSMGMWVGQFNSSRPVEYLHNLKFCQFGCIDDYYTAHYQSPRQMICMWNKLQMGKPECCNMRWHPTVKRGVFSSFYSSVNSETRDFSLRPSINSFIRSFFFLPLLFGGDNRNNFCTLGVALTAPDFVIYHLWGNRGGVELKCLVLRKLPWAEINEIRDSFH